MRLLPMACALIVLVACGSNEDPALESPSAEPEDTPTAAATTGSSPGLTISEPAEGATIPAGDVTVTVSVTNFDVVDKLALGADPVAGEGHIHFYLDVDEIPTAPGLDAGGRRTFPRGEYRAVGATTYTWPDVAAGEHTLAAQLFQNGHTPLQPSVTDEVTVTVD